jgi:predicted naringenin-chalcone synthase
MSYLQNIITKNPTYSHSQEEIGAFMLNAYGNSDSAKRLVEAIYRQSGIETRYSVLPDFDLSLLDRKSNYALSNHPTEFRMKLFHKHAVELAHAAAAECIEKTIEKDKITHIITVSCTGMQAPGIEIELIKLLKLNQDVERLAINFMGCYAAINALRTAKHICDASKSANVLIVCVELCTLHFNIDTNTDNVAAASLFGDGCAAAIVSGEKNDKGVNYKLSGFHSHFNTAGEQDMGWHITAFGFEMILSRLVPVHIQTEIESVIATACDKHHFDKHKLVNYCIHPGGRKILDLVKDELKLDDKLKHSYKVLNDYGNMSSPTVLYVLKEIIQSNTSPKPTIMAAFGPGLTTEIALLNLE